MKKQSFFINNDGFILPSITFIIFLLFIVFTTNILIYKQEAIIAKHHIEQLKIESLIHLGLESYKESLNASETFINNQMYAFPQGQVTISATESSGNDRITVNLQVITDYEQKYLADFIIPFPNE